VYEVNRFTSVSSQTRTHTRAQDKLNVYEIDAVKDALRVAVQEEKTYLIEDIEYLTALLTDETDVHVSMCQQGGAL